MFQTIVTIMKVEMSISINGFIYFLKRIPLIKKLFKNTSYGFLKIKNILGYFAFIYGILSSAFKAVFLTLIFAFGPRLFLDEGEIGNTMILLLLLFLGLRLVRSTTLENNRQKFILVKQMRMNPKEYAFADLIKNEGFKLLGRLLAFSLLVWVIDNSLPESILFAFMVTAVAVLSESLWLAIFKKSTFILEEHPVLTIVAYSIVVGLGYLGYFLLIDFNIKPYLFHPIALVLFGVMFILGVIYLKNYKVYGEAIRTSISLEKMTNVENVRSEANFLDVKMEEKDYQVDKTKGRTLKDKEGFTYLHGIFIQRHRKIFRNPILMKSIIVIAVFALIFIIDFFIDENVAKEMTLSLTDNYNIFIFLIYLLCNSTRQIKAFFYNCDLSMLKYGFYRKPANLLKMFGVRFRTLLLSNFVPTGLIMLGLFIAVFVSGTGDYLSILPVGVMLVALTVFYTIHYLFMYYIFQPYTSSMEVKNPFYNFVNWFMYFLAYVSLQIDAPALWFLPVLIIAAFIYAGIAIILIYRKAPQTFRVK